MKVARLIMLVVVIGCTRHQESGVSDEQMNAINKKMGAAEAAAAQEDAVQKFTRPPGGFPPRQLPAELTQQDVINAIETCFAPNKVSRLDDVYGNDRHVIVFFTWTDRDSKASAPGSISFDLSGDHWQKARSIKVVRGGRESHHMCP